MKLLGVAPPCAPLTMTRLGFLDGSAFATGKKRLNSFCAVDSPMAIRTYFPVGLGLPLASSGWIPWANATPSES